MFVINEQCWSRRQQGGQMTIVSNKHQVGGILLQIASILWMISADSESDIAGIWSCGRDARIQRAQHDRLPTTAGEPGHAYTRGIGFRVHLQEINAAFDNEIKNRNTIDA